MNNLQRPSAKNPSHRPVKIPFFPQAGNKYDRSTNFEASVYSSSYQSSHTRNYHHDHHQHSIYISMHVPAAHTPISELQLIAEGINEDESPTIPDHLCIIREPDPARTIFQAHHPLVVEIFLHPILHAFHFPHNLSHQRLFFHTNDLISWY